ncbi:hypothetical protein HALO59_150506 [Halomonas sp. 59]|nr:hypothetical protein HALO59_150506 [Halomonas sp. 59]CAD5261033.1 hypothetical protein HALO113_160508 [Halomonas sp. 113]VXB42050.1 hypothetical protein HALO98_160502 [Halomonas titanicae]VXC43343.1 hypothetical protein HALO153_330128 [Halomonas titanicae]
MFDGLVDADNFDHVLRIIAKLLGFGLDSRRLIHGTGAEEAEFLFDALAGRL